MEEFCSFTSYVPEENQLCIVTTIEGHTDINGSMTYDAINYYIGKYSKYYSYKDTAAFIVNNAVMYFPYHTSSWKYL